jgi:toxin YoeB
MNLEWHEVASAQYDGAPEHIRRKINKLVEAILEHPYKGIGKPEPLREYRDDNLWSRRVTKKHRLVYRVVGDEVQILQCLGHYADH